MPDTENPGLETPAVEEEEEHDEIRVCDTCETPLIMTFMVPFKEWYCTGCGDSSEFLGAGSRVAWTPELQKQKEDNEAKFKAIYHNMVPKGARMKKCEKCNRSATHDMHMTDEEVAADTKARADLKTMLLPEHRE